MYLFALARASTKINGCDHAENYRTSKKVG